MASLKIVLRLKVKKDGTYPLALRIIKDRKPTFTFLGHSIDKKHWDPIAQRVKKSHPNSARLNNLLSAKFAEANNKLLELETDKNDLSAAVIKNSIKGIKATTFKKQAEVYLTGLLKAGKFNRLSADKPRIKQFLHFIGNDATFKEITVPLLQQFKTHLRLTREVNERTVNNYLVVIRSVFSQAIAAKVVDQKHYPFGKGKMLIKFPESIKIGLSHKEIETLEAADFTAQPKLHHARNLWLFSFYFAGMRVSDELRLKWSDFQNNRLYYAMGKNAKAGSLKIPEKAAAIIEEYRRPDPVHDLVFPDLETLSSLNKRYEVEKRINQRVKLLNEYLRNVAKIVGITKPLTMHIARHTFGNLSGDRIQVQMLQKLYRHSSITTTINYQANFIHKDADEALETVLSA